MTSLTSCNLTRIGIGSVDREHAQLIHDIDTLQAATESANDAGQIAALLCQLVQDTRAHFTAEEAMMAAAKYPAVSLHALKHQRLLEQLSALCARCGKDSFILTRHSLSFLHEWVACHIQSDDMNFGLWLNEHGKR